MRTSKKKLKKLRLRNVMLDGAIVGAELVGSLEIKKSEVHQIQKIMLAQPNMIDDSGSLAVLVQSKGGSLQISLRKHYHNQVDKFYLNISGNPLKFMTGSNVYGYAEADRVMAKAYMVAVTSIGLDTKRIKEAIRNRDIFIYSLEFAAYTNPVPDKKQLLNDWAYMYRTSYSTDGLHHEALVDLLNIRFERKHKDHKSSICLRLLNKRGTQDDVMLMAYDKEKEIKDHAKDSSTLQIVPKDIENRIRIDLNLCRGWFQAHQVDGKKISTLRHLVAYIDKNYEGKWHKFLAFEFDKAVTKARLFSMWDIDVEQALSSDKPADRAMAKARCLMRLTDKQWEIVIKKKIKLPLLVTDPHPYEIKLDMSVVRD